MTVMFGFVWTVTFDILGTLNPACTSQMFLFPIFFILKNAWVHVSTTNCSNIASNVETLIDETFGFGTTLNIPNFKPYDGYI